MIKKMLFLVSFLFFTIQSFCQKDTIIDYQDIILDKESEAKGVGMTFFGEELKDEILVMVNGDIFEYDEFMASNKPDNQDINSLYIHKNLQEIFGCTNIEKKYLIIITTHSGKN